MRRCVRQLTYGLGLAAVFCILNAGLVFADNALCNPNAPAEVLNSEVCQDQEDPIAGPGGLIHDITVIVSTVAGILAVIMIMYGGFKYITSSGDSGGIEEAKKTLIYSVIGLIVIILARTIILFVINRV